MISVLMLLAGLFLMSADSIPVVIVGLILLGGAAYREGAFYI